MNNIIEYAYPHLYKVNKSMWMKITKLKMKGGLGNEVATVKKGALIQL